MIDIESIGSRVKYHRLRNKISQEELADLAQVSRVHISYLERGERIPSMESFINIANALNVTSDDLLLDNLKRYGTLSDNELLSFMLDCNKTEKAIITKAMKSLKALLSEHGI